MRACVCDSEVGVCDEVEVRKVGDGGVCVKGLGVCNWLCPVCSKSCGKG